MHWNVGDQPSNVAAVDTDLDPWLLLVINCSNIFDEYFLMVGMVRKLRNDVKYVKEDVCLERDVETTNQLRLIICRLLVVDEAVKKQLTPILGAWFCFR